MTAHNYAELRVGEKYVYIYSTDPKLLAKLVENIKNISPPSSTVESGKGIDGIVNTLVIAKLRINEPLQVSQYILKRLGELGWQVFQIDNSPFLGLSTTRYYLRKDV